VRVTRWDLGRGQGTGRRVHAYGYVAVPITDGQTEAIATDGTSSSSELRTGVSYARPAGGEHEVTNTDTRPLVIIEIELKYPSSGATEISPTADIRTSDSPIDPIARRTPLLPQKPSGTIRSAHVASSWG
jgi:hypothetical protein